MLVNRWLMADQAGCKPRLKARADLARAQMHRETSIEDLCPLAPGAGTSSSLKLAGFSERINCRHLCLREGHFKWVLGEARNQ